MNAFGMSMGTQYVAAAYGVVLFALLVAVVTVGRRAARVARQAESLAPLVAGEPADHDEGAVVAVPSGSVHEHAPGGSAP